MEKKYKIRSKIGRPQVYELMFGSNPNEVVNIEKFLRSLRKKVEIDDGAMYRLLVSCTEAVNNAIVHGNKLSKDKKVSVIFRIGKHVLTVRVKDEGKGFNVSKVPNPLNERNILKENGRGIFLMRALMDKVKFKKLKFGHVVELQLRI